MNRENEYGQSIGQELLEWEAPLFPEMEVVEGQSCRLEPLNADAHAAGLFAAFASDDNDASWTYLPYGPFGDFIAFEEWIEIIAAERDPQFYVVVSKPTGMIVGLLSYLRIEPEVGSIEIGHIHFSKFLRKTPAATEAIYLLMNRAFELGYRRFEWKCDALNTPSCRAAERFGFTFEGIFRQATIYKKRNRDTAWYSVIDAEWANLNAAFLQWLNPDNFDDEGNQRVSLRDLTREGGE